MKKRICFLWNGVHRYGGTWKDGLWLAMKRLEEDFDIKYLEPTDIQGIADHNPDLILIWASSTENCLNGIKALPYKKALLFAGGQIDANIKGFDMYFVESEINESELERLGLPWMRAFGVNEEIFKPINLDKKYDGMIAGTFALWKRHEIFAEAVKEKGVAIGIHQEHESVCYKICEFFDVEVHEELPREKVAEYINKSHTVVNTASFWGGGQRLTLEAMACGVPPIVMSDSPKNCEYVREAGFGVICTPNPEAVRKAIEEAKTQDPQKGIDYIQSKWTSKNYAARLKAGINKIL